MPTARGKWKEDDPSGLVPILQYAKVKKASSEAITKSQASARDTPAPAAAPLQLAIIGFGILRIANMIVCKSWTVSYTHLRAHET